METVRIVVESFIRLVKAEIDPDAVLVAADDVFEVPIVEAEKHEIALYEKYRDYYSYGVYIAKKI